jgi:hypothetical protein
MKVYLKLTYKDGSTNMKRVRQTPNFQALQVIIDHYAQLRGVVDVKLEIK